jgi:PKD repeat protein
VSKSWDFSNDGITDSAKMNPVYEFVTQGNYTVNLTVKNVNGANSKLATINVLTKSNSSGGNSGRNFGGSSGNSENSGNNHKSGGIGGGSPETVRNVQVKELLQAFITGGKPVKFDFTKNATYVVYGLLADFCIKKVKSKVSVKKSATGGIRTHELLRD